MQRRAGEGARGRKCRFCTLEMTKVCQSASEEMLDVGTYRADVLEGTEKRRAQWQSAGRPPVKPKCDRLT